MDFRSLLHSYYKKDDLDHVLLLLEQHAKEQENDQLLTIVHTQQARIAEIKKRYQIEGSHRELNIERNQLRAAIYENFVEIDDSIVYTDNNIDSIKQESIPGIVDKSYQYIWIIGLLILLGGITYKSLNNWREKSLSDALENKQKINLNQDTLSSMTVPPSPQTDKLQAIENKAKYKDGQPSGNVLIGLRIQSDRDDLNEILVSKINSVLLEKHISTITFKAEKQYANIIDCQMFVKEKTVKSGIVEDAISYIVTLRVNIVNGFEKQCFSDVFQSSPLIGYANTDNTEIVQKGLTDVLRQLSKKQIMLCKN